MVYKFAYDMNVPFIITMGGGYPNTNDWEPIIQAHTDVFVQAYKFLNNSSN